MILSAYQYVYGIRTGDRFTVVLYIGRNSGDCPYNPAVESSGSLACVTVPELCAAACVYTYHALSLRTDRAIR